MRCEDKNRLLLDYQTAARLYSLAVGQFKERCPTANQQTYRDLRGLAELLVSKQRNGPVGKIDLVFLHHLTKFENRAEDLGEVEN